MPFLFTLPTTSQLSFQPSLTSSTHPSLPSTTTSHRALVRSALKKHKRLALADKTVHLPNLVSVIEDQYLKYLVSIDLALSGKSVAGEDVDIALVQEVEVEWRPTLSSSSSSSSATSALRGVGGGGGAAVAGRVKGRGFDFELFFTLHTLALVHSLLARQSLLGLYAASSGQSILSGAGAGAGSSTASGDEQRALLVQNATKRLRTVYSIHAYLVQRAHSSPDGPPAFPPGAPDISVPIQTGLQNLAHAELDLLGVLKDDPYPAVVQQSRNKNDREWMYKSPTIPKVAAQVRRRLCLGAAEKAEAALANLRSSPSPSGIGSSTKVSKDLINYCEDVRRTAKAKACRFAALDADMSGETGKAIAWLRAGMHELDKDDPTSTSYSSSSAVSGLKKLKASWNEKREDRKAASSSSSSSSTGAAAYFNSNTSNDGGKAEEGRILEYLHAKLSKENDRVNIQAVPDWRPLLSTLPSGMHISVTDVVWRTTTLSEDELVAMRSPPEAGAVAGQDDSSDEENEGRSPVVVVGAFPGAEDGSQSTYY